MLHWSKKLPDEEYERAPRGMKFAMVRRKQMGRSQTGPPAGIWETNLSQRYKKPSLLEWSKWEVSCHSCELELILFAFYSVDESKGIRCIRLSRITEIAECLSVHLHNNQYTFVTILSILFGNMSFLGLPTL